MFKFFAERSIYVFFDKLKTTCWFGGQVRLVYSLYEWIDTDLKPYLSVENLPK